MNILMVSSFLPYPLLSGGHIRLYNLIKELSKRHRITLICEKRKYQTEKEVKEVKKICEVIWIERKKQWSIENILKTGFSTYPFLMTGHTNSQMKRAIEKAITENKFDLIHIETFYVMQNLPSINIPTVLIEHNIEYLVYQRFVQRMSIFSRPILLIDILKMKHWEQKFWQTATKVVCVSENEKNLIKKPGVEVVPNGVDLEKFKIKSFDKAQDKNSKFKIREGEKRILFIGDFRWVQNRDAIKWILEEIWPDISSKLRELKLWVVGRDIPDSIKNLTRGENIIFDENASEDTGDIFRKSDVLLSPIRVGGGTSFKILEAMASGVPVVTTPLGIEGIDAKDGTSVVIASDSLSLVSKTLDLFENEEKYQRIVINARRLIEEKYDWKIIVRELEKIYESIVHKKDK